MNYCINGFNFIEAMHMSDSPFNDLKFDGIFGIGLLELSITGSFNFFKLASSLQQFEIYNNTFVLSQSTDNCDNKLNNLETV